MSVGPLAEVEAQAMEDSGMLRKLSRATLALLGIALLAGCAGMMGGDRRETNAEVVLISFGGSNGELAPCG